MAVIGTFNPAKRPCPSFHQAPQSLAKTSNTKNNGINPILRRFLLSIFSLDLSGSFQKPNSLKSNPPFQHRSSNSIKNRFYTVVRTFLKILFRAHPLLKKRLPHEIPSKTILKFYEGREGKYQLYPEFSRFKGFGKKILKSIDYNLESKQLHKIARNNLDEIL